ncbi:MAG: adenine deaminase [Planctomycetes bacterium]|nr:adenine deaminase [Planctomycetota bacterium]
MDPAVLRRRIRVARGLEPGDLLLKGAQVVNVFTQQLHEADVVIADGFVAGVGPYRWEAAMEISVAGSVIFPSLIDAHIHLESTLLLPGELARLIVPHGTGTVIADPHEIANVMGIRGVELLVAQSQGLPLDMYFMAPSCVPAVNWEHAGANLDAAAIDELLQIPGVLGLGEMMNFPGVLEGDDDVVEKIATTAARRAVIDGHAPGVTGRDLLAYAAAGIRSDHESTEIAEARAKAALGMLLQVREGSIARNLDTLTPLLLEEGIGDWCLCTDDIHPDDLAANGHLDALLRRLVAAGMPPERAIRHTTLVPARHYGLADRGAVAPGYKADLVVADDLTEFGVSLVIKNGRVVARGGRYLGETAPCEIRPDNTVHLPALDESAFGLSAGLPDGGGASPVIGIVEDQIITRHLSRSVKRSDDGLWAFDPDVDVVVIASIERHRASGSIGLGLVEGFGFRRHGALGSSVAHDSHNLIIAGTNPTDMLLCARALAETGGGFVVAAGGAIAGRLPLPVAGLLSMSDAETVCRQLIEVRQAARALGSQLPCPFGTLSFLALSVIPELRITDQGLYDVVNQRFV